MRAVREEACLRGVWTMGRLAKVVARLRLVARVAGDCGLRELRVDDGLGAPAAEKPKARVAATEPATDEDAVTTTSTSKYS